MTDEQIMRPNPSIKKIYLYRDPIDFRKAHRGLVALVEFDIDHNPFDGHLYAFTNKRKNCIKCIFWEDNGFVLYHKVLSEEKFKWPKKTDDVVCLTGKQMNFLLDGYDVMKMKPLKKLDYQSSS